MKNGLGLGLSIALASLLSAAQPWDKKPADWTAADIDHLLTTSPWVQPTAATVTDPQDEPEQPAPGPLPGAKEAGLPGAPHGAPWDGGPGRNRMGSLPTIPVVVRWDSAMPIQQALKRSTAQSTATPDAYPHDYHITVLGLIPAGRYRAAGQPQTTSSSDNAVDARNPEELLEAFMSSSRLLPRNGVEIHPENVQLDPSTGAVHIFFPRTHPIELKQKEVLFVTHFGSLNVRTKFRLTAMKVQGKLEL
ncbi:MAG TPA: hypothetical protein VGL97_12420 [Bryobacteraceae bacterium]|jgi:hypothetical protein